MLCLGRKIGESVILEIPPSTEHRTVNFVVTGIRHRGTQVRLGIEASKDINIYRHELKEAKDAAGSD